MTAGRASSGFGAYDIELGGVPLMLIRDGKPAVTQHLQMPAEQGKAVPLRQQVWLWQNAGGGAGASYQSPDADATGMVEIGTDVWLRDAGAATGAGERVEVPLPPGLAGAVGRICAVVPRWRGAVWLATTTRHLLRVVDPLAPGLVTTSAPLLVESLAVWGAGLVAAGREGNLHYMTSEIPGSGDTAPAFNGRFLATPYWVIGNQLATGGSAGQGGTGAPRLIATSPDGTGYYHLAAADPRVSANWSSLVRVVPAGHEEYPIVGTAQSTRVVWFPTAEGVRGATQTGYSPNFNPWMKARYDIRNGVGSVYWRNAIWYPHRDGLVMVRTDGTLQDAPIWVQFGAGRANQTSVWGRPRALCPAGDYLYVAYFDGTDSYLMALTLDGQGQPRWYGAEAVIRGQEITLIHAVSSTQLYLATIVNGTGSYDLGTGVMKLWVQRLPFSDSPLTDIRRGYSWRSQPSWSVTLPRVDDYSSDPKQVQQVDLVAPVNLTGGNTVAIETSPDDGPFTTVATAVQGPRYSSSPSGPVLQGVAVQPRVTVTNNPVFPVVVRSVAMWTTADPQVTTVKHYRVVVDAGATLRNKRGTEKRDPRLVVNDVLALQGAPEIPFVDETGQSMKVRLEPSVQAQLLEREDGRGWVALLELDLTVLRPPVIQTMPPPFPPIDPPPAGSGPFYDTGYLYDHQEVYK